MSAGWVMLFGDVVAVLVVCACVGVVPLVLSFLQLTRVTTITTADDPSASDTTSAITTFIMLPLPSPPQRSTLKFGVARARRAPPLARRGTTALSSRTKHPVSRSLSSALGRCTTTSLKPAQSETSRTWRLSASSSSAHFRA